MRCCIAMTLQVLHAKVADLEGKLETKRAECENYSAANRQLRAEVDEERRRRVSLDQKLDSEQKAAKIVAQDITRCFLDFSSPQVRKETDLPLSLYNPSFQ